MGKIYELYGPDERRIDNLKRRIRGYEKMKKDITNQNRKLNKQNRELKKQLEEVEFIVGLRQKRNLISKFDKEYDEEDKKKNPNRDYAGIMPDAEEIYKRYYAMKNQQKKFIQWLENEIDKCKYGEENYADGDDMSYHNENELRKEILSKHKEITGGKK